MKLEQTIWFALVRPAISSALLVGVCALWLVGGAAAACVAAGSIVTVGVMCWIFARQAQRVQAALRNPGLRTTEGNGSGFYGQMQDEIFRALQKAEEAARQARQAQTEAEAHLHIRQSQIRRLEAAFNSLADPVVLTDPSDEPVFWNAAAARLFREEERDGATLALANVPAVRDLIIETRTRAAATNVRSTRFETTIGGTAHPFEATATNVHDEAQNPLGVVVTIRNTGREVEEKARQAEFVSAVCHELKTPMASMKAFVELLIDGEVTEREERTELYGFIDIQIDRLTRLVNNMLNLARIESGVIKVQRIDCGLNQILEKSFDVVQPMARDKQISLVPELSDLHIPVRVDADLFGQAVINLLSNAIKYTPNGGEVRLRSRLLEDEAVIDVRDNGLGIPEASLPHLFERFYRVPENDQAAAGTGLGLALVQYIVTDVHNGRITVDSAVNAGSCFSIRIPLADRRPAKRRLETACHP